MVEEMVLPTSSSATSNPPSLRCAIALTRRSASPSASRWFDGYFAVGLEWDRFYVASGTRMTNRYTVTETGIKFRVASSARP